jgi:hypothetical protein
MAAVAGVVTWTTTTVILTLYLHNKFRALEIAFYRGLGKHRQELDCKLYEHGGRIMRLELKLYGSTLEPGLSQDHDDGE